MSDIERRDFFKLAAILGSAAGVNYLTHRWSYIHNLIRLENPQFLETIPSESVLFGLSPDGNNTQVARETARKLNTHLGVINYFSGLHSDIENQEIRKSIILNASEGVISMLSWECTAVIFQSDDTFHLLARSFKDYKTKFLFRPCYEMNGKWSPVGPSHMDADQFQKCWRKMRRIFWSEHADNVDFVFSPNVTIDAAPIEPYFPGNSYVNIVSLDVYDKHNAFSLPITYSADAMLGPDIASLQKLAPNKPFILSEVNAIDNPDWVYDAISVAIRAGARAVIPFAWNKAGAGTGEIDWRVDTNRQLAEILSVKVRDSCFVQNPRTFDENFSILRRV